MCAVAAAFTAACGQPAPPPVESNGSPSSVEVTASGTGAAVTSVYTASGASAWDIPPLNVTGWKAVELIQAHYPAQLRISGAERQVVYTVCVDPNGAVTEIRFTVERNGEPVDESVVAAGRRVLAGYRYLPAWRYLDESETRVEPVEGCRGDSVYFYEGQFEKSRHDPTPLGTRFILNGQLVRLWDAGMVVPVEEPGAMVAQGQVADRRLTMLDPDRIVAFYELEPPEIRERFGYGVARAMWIIETD